jgi:hypothetical protein
VVEGSSLALEGVSPGHALPFQHGGQRFGAPGQEHGVDAALGGGAEVGVGVVAQVQHLVAGHPQRPKGQVVEAGALVAPVLARGEHGVELDGGERLSVE